ncbi:vWA domain-containing protein [Oceanobacillus bengalensis]|uniref:VWA domain-containing protein n=1 Tax=Oceanobacillus bengalensis TaxID=1435466 RepID=A0A494Z4W4_9BACI|nr:VWA domain-containing protein [Oceanobacillus bengalensis]RKQ17514.1 VWA domain-containing protein [Oceanobacillus bengalensis]
MLKKGIYGVAIILILFIFVGCTEKENVAEPEEPQGTENKEITNDEVQENKETGNNKDILDGKLETISFIDSIEGMKARQGGTLVEGISIDEEAEDDYQVEDEVFVQELREISNETQEAVFLYKGLVHLLGSPHYKSLIEKAESFVPNFEDPYLPAPQVENERAWDVEKNGKAFILLDASSSMQLTVDGQVKMDIARRAAEQFAEVIGHNNELSLIVYGHKGSESEDDKELSCNGIEEVYPMGVYDEEAFEQTLKSFESNGYTPLAGAIKKVNTLSSGFMEAVTVYIISDGVETCDGDPALEAESFVSNDENRVVNIIGFDVDEVTEGQLRQVSEAGNGEYFSANNANELKTTIEKKWLPSTIDLAWAHTMAPDPWEILNEYDRFDIDLNIIRTVIQTEKDRFDLALRKLREEDLITSETASEISDLITDEYRVKLDLIRDLRSTKLDEIDREAEEIREEIDEWVEEMRGRKQK